MLTIIKNEHITASISSFGAELVSLTKNNKNYIWTINEQYWNKTSPILFPIVGRLKNDSYTLKNKEYSMSRHGFARNFDFKVISKTEDSVCFSLQENLESLQQYPFQFELQICYTLIENQLTVSYFIQNNSETKMPFSIGAHPAFAISSDFENYNLQFENDDFLKNHQLENEHFSGKTKKIALENKKLPLAYSLFEIDALVFKEFKSKIITILENNIPYLKINLGNFPNLGIWTKKNAPFLCIEPWFGYADNENTNGNILEKSGIQILETNKTFETSFSIEIL